MELQATTHETHSEQDEREWELADEDLDRGENKGFSCTTSRPCSSSRCQCR